MFFKCHDLPSSCSNPEWISFFVTWTQKKTSFLIMWVQLVVFFVCFIVFFSIKYPEMFYFVSCRRQVYNQCCQMFSIESRSNWSLNVTRWHHKAQRWYRSRWELSKKKLYLSLNLKSFILFSFFFILLIIYCHLIYLF